MVNYYENLVVGEIKLSSKAIESLEKVGIYEFQLNEPVAGLYDVSIHRDHQTDDITMFLKRKGVNHLFTFIIPPYLREIKIGKEEISLKFL